MTTTFGGHAFQLADNYEKYNVSSHYILSKNGSPRVHIIVFQARQNFFYVESLNTVLNKFTHTHKNYGPELTFGMNGPLIFDPFELAKVRLVSREERDIDALKIHIATEAAHFLSQMTTSRLITCDLETAQTLALNRSDSSVEDSDPDSKIARTQAALASQYIPLFQFPCFSKPRMRF